MSIQIMTFVTSNICIMQMLKHELVKENVQIFIEWFLENKVIVIEDNMMHLMLEEADLGSFLDVLYTNAIEGVNNIIKSKVNYKH